SLLIHNLMFYSICCILIGQPDRAQDHPGSKQILAKLAGKNQHLRKTNISEVGSLCNVKSMGYNMYRKKIHRWTEWPRGQSEYKIMIIIKVRFLGYDGDRLDIQRACSSPKYIWNVIDSTFERPSCKRGAITSRIACNWRKLR